VGVGGGLAGRGSLIGGWAGVVGGPGVGVRGTIRGIKTISRASILAALVPAGLTSAGLVLGGGCRGVRWGGFGVLGADPAEHRGDDSRTVEALQRAVEQTDVQVGADLGQQAGMPGTPDLRGQLVDAGHRPGRVVRGQAVAGDDHGAFLVQIRGDSAPAYGLAVTPRGPFRSACRIIRRNRLASFPSVHPAAGATSAVQIEACSSPGRSLR
jgi:hypothetical protein